ncbi:hypothetical protein M758_5G163600 [Ceratodon purpureus]|nr:hypothetical protein M758_5G163600 [Ceratodon purpureus]KAG0617106.1 hypothetical protein M758_5G163600 [Ceratodon purpureus]
MIWRCTIPGKVGTDWEGGSYPVTIYFSEEYPTRAPKCMFPKGFFHPNVYDTGDVCLSIIGSDWRPAISVKQILEGIQELLDDPNLASAAQHQAYNLFYKDRASYNRRIKKQAEKYPAPPI